MKRMNNYYTKLFIVILTILTVSSVILSGISIIRNVKSLRSVTEKSLTSSAQQKDELYQSNISSLHALSESIGNDPQITDFFKKVRAGKTDMKFYRYLQVNLEEEMQLYPGILENAFFTYDGLGYVDGLGGTTVNFSIIGQNSEWYLNAIKNKKHYLGKIKQSPITGMPVMVSAYPILDENNEVLSVFALAINLNGFSKVIISNDENTKETTFIVDEAGAVIAADDTDLIYNFNISSELPKLYQYTRGNKEGITYYTKDNVRYVAAVKKSILGATIIQSIPIHTYWNPICESVAISVFLLLLIIGCAAVITFFVAKNITKPIHILVEELNEMAEGNYEKEIPDYLQKRRDEFAKLAGALSKMKNQTNQLIMKLNLAYEETEASLEEVVATEEELRKQNELLFDSRNQLKKSNDYNKAIINVLPDIIYIIDGEGTINDCQENLQIYPYIKRERFVNKNIREIISDEIAEIICKKIKTALDCGELQCFEYEFRKGNDYEIFEFRIVQCFKDSVIAISRNVTDQRLYQRQIEYLSYHDQLTGLYNRRFFEEELKHLDEKIYLPLCIIMSDVNGLKLINDSFGHAAGDTLLKKFSEVLNKSCSADMRICRIGGDEFVILGPNMTGRQAEELVGKIKENCSKIKVHELNLSVSLGWEIRSNIEDEIRVVLKSAEDYMYKKKLFDGPSMRGRTIRVIINTLHEKNKREEQHSHRVAEFCEQLAVALDMPEHERKEIRNAGLLHDIGKIAIPDTVLNKPGKLTQEEYEEIERHPEIGYRILCSSNEMTDIAEYVLCHHERWDGKGYPRGLREEEIPLQARMIAIADTYDAMTSLRCYREPVSETEAAKEILKNAGTQFDPKLARLFVREVLGYQEGE